MAPFSDEFKLYSRKCSEGNKCALIMSQIILCFKFKVVLASVALHNFIKLNQLVTQYCPPAFVDSEDSSGNIIPGRWRQEIDETCSTFNAHKKPKLGSNNSSKRAFQLRDCLNNYFLNEGVTQLQEKIK